MVREFTKWDYELRAGQPVAAIVDRALDIAMSEPRGPVYLTLPREVLSDPAIAARRGGARPLGAIAAVPSREAIEQAAALIAGAQFPLIVTSAIGRSPEAFAAFAALTEEFALPVVQSEPERPQSAVEPSDKSRLRSEVAAAARRRGFGARCGGAVGAEGGDARARRQNHPYLGGSAAEPVSVPRFRGRSVDRRHRAGRLAAVARQRCGRRCERRRRRQAPPRPWRRCAKSWSPAAAARSRPPRRACRSPPRTSPPASTR